MKKNKKGGDKKNMNKVTFNLKGYTIRTEAIGQKKYIVAPVTMLTEGVHTGSDGPLFYSSRELAKFPSSWNGTPVTVNHPEHGVSAPTVLESHAIGYVWDCHYDQEEKKLKGEVWVDIEETKKKAPSILTKMKKGESIEVSTGLYSDDAGHSGTWNGETFRDEAINIRPDHLAILPDEEGACSIKDGCGIRANQSSYQEAYDEVMKSNKQSHGSLETKIRSKVSSMSVQPSYANGGGMICAIESNHIYDDHFVYIKRKYDKEGKPSSDPIILMQKYTVDKNDNIQFIDDPVEVCEEIKFIPIKTNEEGKEKEVKKNKKVDVDIVLNTKQMGYSEGDREVLENMEEGQFSKLLSIANQFKECECREEEMKKNSNMKKNASKSEEEEEEEMKKKKKKEGEEEEKAKGNKALTLDEYISNAPREMQEVLMNSVNMHNEYKSELVEVITKNEKNKLTKEYLQSLDLKTLEAIADLAEVDEKPETKNTTTDDKKKSYVGQAGTQNNNTKNAPEAPKVNWKEEVDKRRQLARR